MGTKNLMKNNSLIKIILLVAMLGVLIILTFAHVSLVVLIRMFVLTLM